MVKEDKGPLHKMEDTEAGAPAPVRQFYIHMISDATGSTLQGLARACLAQFDDIDPVERFWPLVRSERQLDRVMQDVADYPGPVLFTMVDRSLRRKLQKMRGARHSLYAGTGSDY